LLAHVPAERIAATAKAAQKPQEISARRKVRYVEVGNGMYPTHASASRFGLSRDEMARFFWNAVSTDFTELQRNAQQLKQILSTTKQLHVTTPNGTDLRLAILPKTINTSDGTIYDAAGNMKARNAYLPAGEVYALTVPGSANGRIVLDYYFDRGAEIRDLTLEVVNGRMVSMKAASPIDALQANFAAATGNGKDLLSILDFGINPGISAANTKLRTWVASGTVTPIVGSDTWAGGSNYSSFSIDPFLANATVTADGRVIVENGQLKL
jgi:leucyl aminopeptidase (aminopeptidase T)